MDISYGCLSVNPDQTGIIMSHLGSFRPSDREALSRYFDDGQTSVTALAGVQEFVRQWETADWLHAYSVERIGRWIARNRPGYTVETLKAWAGQNPSEARKALLAGLLQGEAEGR